MKNIVLIFILFLKYMLCLSQNTSNTIIQESKIRFYDFNISIELIDESSNIPIKQYLLYNSGNYQDESRYHEYKLLQNSVYFISNTLSKKKQNRYSIEHSDTVICQISNSQLDTLFDLTITLFRIKVDTNLDRMKTPATLISVNKNIAKVILDLGFRGNKYILYNKTGDSDLQENYHFNKLLSFLNKLKQ